MLKLAVAFVIATCAAAFHTPAHSPLAGTLLRSQAARRTYEISMSATDEAISRRAALSSILAAAIAIPGIANAAFETEKGKDRHWQLRQAWTDVQSSAMSGSRTSTFGSSILGGGKTAVKLDRKPMSEDELATIDSLQSKLLRGSATNGYKTSEQRIGINRVFGGSSGIYNGGA